MKTIVVGGSKGIGKALVEKLLALSNLVNIGESVLEISHNNFTHHNCDATQDELPKIDPAAADGLIYRPESINQKAISRLSIDDFKNDFEINVLGAVKVIQNIFQF